MELLGVALSIGATFAGSLGDNCVKLAYNKVYRAPELSLEEWQCGNARYGCMTSLWLAGWVSTIFGNTVLNAFALMYAPASLVSPSTAPTTGKTSRAK